MARGQILLELPSAEAIGRLDEIEDAYLSGTSETEEDHIERKRRKDKTQGVAASAGPGGRVGPADRADRLHQQGRGRRLLLRSRAPAARMGAAGTDEEEEAEMAYRTAELPPVELDEFDSIPFFERMKMLQLHWVEGRVRHSEADDDVLRVEDLLLRVVRADLHRRLHGRYGVQQHRRLVGRADPLPEVDDLDDPARGHGARRHVRSDGVPLRSADRRDPLLVAARHVAGAAVPEPRAVHQGQPPHAVGHRALQAHHLLARDDDVPVRRTGRRVARRHRRVACRGGRCSTYAG